MAMNESERLDSPKRQLVTALKSGFENFAKHVHQHPFLVARAYCEPLLDASHLRVVMYIRGKVNGLKIWLVIPFIEGKDLETGKIYLSAGLSPHFRRDFNHMILPHAYPQRIDSESFIERPFAHHLPHNARVLTTNQLRGANVYDLLLNLLERFSFRLLEVNFCFLRHTSPNNTVNPRTWDNDQEFYFHQVDTAHNILAGRYSSAELESTVAQGTALEHLSQPAQTLVILRNPVFPHLVPASVQNYYEAYVQNLAKEGEKMGWGKDSLEDYLRAWNLQEYTTGPNAQPPEGYYPPDLGDTPFNIFGGAPEPNQNVFEEGGSGQKGPPA